MKKDKYPNINDPLFYKKIKKKYNKFKIPKNKKTMKEICFPKKYTLQLPQRFVADFINPKTPYKGLLLFHKIGAGKTCAAINIAEKWKKKRNILIISPASLMGNFAKELRTKCANDEYITEKERKILDNNDPSSLVYKDIIRKSNDKIKNFYTIMSYHKYIAAVKNKKIKLKNTLLIIDEVQNIVSEKGTFYKILLNSIIKAPDDIRIVLLSATPIFDKPVEIGLTMNLLKLPKPLPTGNEFNKKFLKIKFLKSNEIKYQVKNMKSFKKSIKGYVSYFRGAPPFTFPRRELKYVKCKMSDYQYKSYKTVHTQEGPFRTGDILSLPNNFFMGTRILSNIAFPKKEINEGGFEVLKGKHLKMKNLKTFSIKFYKILKAIKKAEGPVFVYSNFKEYGGLKTLAKVLENNGFKNYKKHGLGKKRFAIWSSDQKHKVKEEIKASFNKKKNKYGSYLKVLLGSPSIKEGVSLLRVREVHVVEPYWNMSRLEQIIGRAIRFCSHKDMYKKDRVVKVFIYIATHPNNKMMVDKYILKLAEKKQNIINDFEKALKESSVDCRLNKNANIYKKENKINCM
jgi:superfamily II DNA or RNA helicase